MIDFKNRPSKESVAIVDFEQLPVGGYEVIILSVEMKRNNNGYQWIDITHDIAEGKYKDHFSKQYKACTFQNPKFKGRHMIGIPQEGHQFFETQFRQFWRHIYAIEESNNGFVFDIDKIDQLKDKKVGAIYHEKEWENLDTNKNGICTQCHSYINVKDIKEGNFKIPPTKMLANKKVESIPKGFKELPYEQLPF